MKLHMPSKRSALLRSCPMLAGGLAMAAAGGLLSQLAAAAIPAAGTQIKAQAAAAYLDGNGTSQIAYSNEVITIVQQVGAFTLTPAAGGTKSAGAGGSVSVPYTITNTGNGTDTFTISLAEPAGGNAFARIDVFADVDANGVADNTTSLLTAGAITTDGGTGASAAISIPAGATYSFVVTYTVPPTATSPWNDTNNVTVTAGNTGIGYAPQALTRTDTVSMATGTSFNVVGSISAPAVAAPGGGTWGATPSSGPWTTSTTYTVSYQNSGAAAGSLYVKFPVPAGFTYQTGSAVWSGNGGVALGETAGSNTNIDYVVTGSNLEAVIPNVPVSGSGTLSFKVVVNNTAAIGKSTTSPNLTYSLQNCGSFTTVAQAGADGASCGSPTSNVAATPFDVTASYALQFGGVDDAGTPGGAGDTYTQANIVAGGSVKYSIPITNKGNVTEAFKLSVDTASMTFPAGSTFSWFAANGATPLVDTTGTGGVDTGPLAPAATVNIVLQVTIPSTTPVAPGVNYQVTALAASAGNPTEKDAALAVATDVIGGYIDLTTDGTNGQGPNTGAVLDTLTVTAGAAGNTTVASPNPAAGTAVFSLQLANNDTASLTFDLRSSQTTTFPGNLPAGWTVSYHTDAAATSTPITQVTVASHGSSTVYAKVVPPGNAPSGTIDVYFQAISTTPSPTTNSIVSDSLRDKVVVQSATAFSFSVSGPGSGQLTSPGSVDYAHNVFNNGGNTCGDPTNGLSIVATLDSGAAAAGWTTALYLDSTTAGTIGQIDPADTLITTGKLAAIPPGVNVPILVRLFAPGGVPAGGTATTTVTVTDLKSGQNCGAQSVIDVASVVSGQVTLMKTQMVDPSCANSAEPTVADLQKVKPGECVIYKVVATNIGSNDARNVQITDVVPAYTTLATTQPPNACVVQGGSGATLNVSVPTITCGPSTTLSPGGTLTLRYAVRVNN